MTNSTLPDNTVIGYFFGTSLLTRNMITIGRVVRCSDGFIPQTLKIPSVNCKDICGVMESYDEAAKALFDYHYEKARKKRCWDDQTFRAVIEEAQALDIKYQRGINYPRI